MLSSQSQNMETRKRLWNRRWYIMFNLIKSGAKIKLAEERLKGVGNTIKDPYARKVVGLIVAGFCIGLGGGLIVSSYE